jgi:hypothetical protein
MPTPMEDFMEAAQAAQQQERWTDLLALAKDPGDGIPAYWALEYKEVALAEIVGAKYSFDEEVQALLQVNRETRKVKAA